MREAEAQREFAIRLYRWVGAQIEREVADGWPSLKSFKDGLGWETGQMMSKLDMTSQAALARALLKSHQVEVLPFVGESLSQEERCLREQWAAFTEARSLHRDMKQLEDCGDTENRRALWTLFHGQASRFLGQNPEETGDSLRARLAAYFEPMPRPFREVAEQRRKNRDKVKFASKRKLRKIMTASFKGAFGAKCIGLACVDEWEELAFDMPCKGWVIHTTFDFGRQESQIGYYHSIWTRKTFESEEMQVKPSRSLGSWFAYCLSLGIKTSEWPYLVDEDIEPTCAAVIEHCRRFFEAAPKLLEGLEPETLTD